MCKPTDPVGVSLNFRKVIRRCDSIDERFWSQVSGIDSMVRWSICVMLFCTIIIIVEIGVRSTSTPRTPRGNPRSFHSPDPCHRVIFDNSLWLSTLVLMSKRIKSLPPLVQLGIAGSGLFFQAGDDAGDEMSSAAWLGRNRCCVCWSGKGRHDRETRQGRWGRKE